MTQDFIKTLSNAAAVTEHLLGLYGADRIWQIEQLSEHIFRGWLNDGMIVLVIVNPDHSIYVRELEEVG